MTAARTPNALANERSPYLLQHAHNPVAWEPWGDAAFERARREDKPVFLSIGYSACHWCHVMERESFEDEATARLLNEHFVSVKVDREERPDVDQVYQLAHQVLTQRAGGWPLSMFLTGDRRPFFGGTYFPNGRRHGMPAFTDVLAALLDAWTTRRDEVVEQAGELTAALSRATPAGEAGATMPDDVLAAAARKVLPRVDRLNGGFGRAPKFPGTMTVDLLVGAAALDLAGVGAEARHAVALTLDGMARGGIFDHLGGGFARYSTDEMWHVPHFEKMLYDNAQLARLYLDGARLLGDSDATTPARCRDVVRATVAYVLREMTSPDGSFYSAQDADSEGEEGRFFVWKPAEVEAVIGRADAPAVCAWFDVTPEGNWEHTNVLWTPRDLTTVARNVGTSPEDLAATVERARPRLFEAREKRPKPMRDDKCLAGWNALMIGALADAGATLGEPAWVDAARRALALWQGAAWNGAALAHAMKDGVAYGTGFLDDHAGMACAAVDVYEATFDASALAFARALMDSVLARFVDEATGELYFTPSDGERVLHRSRDPYDHAYPGGVGLAVDALLRVGELTGHAPFRDAAARCLAAFGPAAAASPMGLATLARAADRERRGAVEVIVLGDPARDDTRALLATARSFAIPHRTLACVHDTADARAHGLDPALTEGRRAGDDGTPVAFVCRGVACEAPVLTPDALAEALGRALHP